MPLLNITGASETIPGKFLDYGGGLYNAMHPNFNIDRTGTRDTTADIKAFVDKCNADGVHGLIPHGQYILTSTVLVDGQRTNIILGGKGVCVFICRPTAHDVPMWKFSTGADAVLYQCSFTGGCSFYSDDWTYRKIAIDATDVSEFYCSDVAIGPIGYWTTTTDGTRLGPPATLGSIGIHGHGRELAVWDRLSVAADRPVVFGANPNSNGSLDVDTWVFRDCILFPQASGAGFDFADENLHVQKFIVEGSTAVVGGKDCIRINKTSGGTTWQDIFFNDIRWENPTAAGGWMVNMTGFTTGAIQNLVIKGCLNGTGTAGGKGYALRRVLSAKIQQTSYFGTDVAIDCDSSCDHIFLEFYIQSGATITMTGLTKTAGWGKQAGYSLERVTYWTSSASGTLWNVSFDGKTWNGKGTLVDDGIATLPLINPAQGGGIIKVLMYKASDGSVHESGIFSVLGYPLIGNLSKKIAGTTNTAAGDIDGDLCCYTVDSVVDVKNRLAATVNYFVTAEWFDSF